MTTIKATMICDSIGEDLGTRISTMLLRYPRCIHAEFMTHRVFSRNASSSRAIPVERLISDVEKDPFIPLFWGSNKPGMQAGDELPPLEREAAETEWRRGLGYAVERARRMASLGAHKQIVNRILEPWAHINVLVTSTTWDNFFELRDHKDAEPHIQRLAVAMKECLTNCHPRTLKRDEWHLPFVDDLEKVGLDIGHQIMISAARAARTSYLTHDGRQPNVDEDIALYKRLAGSRPLHASPLEHQAMIDYGSGLGRPRHSQSHLAGNLIGAIQWRKIVETGGQGAYGVA